MLVRGPPRVWGRRSPAKSSVTRRSRSCLHDHFEATVDHAFSVKGHRIRVRLQAWVGHDLLHALITHLARRPHDPGEDNRLVILALDRHGKRREFAIRYVVAPKLTGFHRAGFFKGGG